MSDVFNPGAIVTGPGILYVANYGATLPTSATGTKDAAFRRVGYTNEGSTFSFSFETSAVEVAEETEPVRVDVTKQEASVKFDMVELSIENLALALNLGANFTGTSIEPPTPGTEQRVVLLLEAASGARWIWKRCLQSGAIEIARKKAPDKGTIPVEFKLEKPLDASKSFVVYKSTTGGLI